jgi:hypothetical protein
MNHYIFDIETYPLSISEISDAMPEEIRAAVMPPELVNPREPEIKVPAYGGDEKRQQEYLDKKKADWRATCERDRAAWGKKIEDKKIAFIESCSLNPKLSMVRLFGLYDVKTYQTIMGVLTAPGLEKKKLDALHELNEKKDSTLRVRLYDNEAVFLQWIFQQFKDKIQSDQTEKFVSYFGNSFDLPYLFRRAWRLGILPPMFLRNGRYWRPEIIDIHEVFSFFDKSYKVGGLDGLCEFLGVEGKTGEGGAFAELWDESPVKAVKYCYADLMATHRCAQKLLGY